MRVFGRAAVLIGWGLSILGSAASAAAAVPQLRLGACVLSHPLRLYSVEALCGTLRVPENRAEPRAATIGLRVAVVRALNRAKPGAPLFLLAGGPGQSAVDLYVATVAAFARVNRDHDIVMVDQRGTGESAPLNCDYPDDWRDGTETLAAVRRATRDCLARFGARVRWYTTSIAVRDLDEVRRALGYSRIDLYGSSYGTRVAEQYMRRYRQAVSAAILDGVVDPVQAIGPQTPLDAEHALRKIVDRCEETRDCALAFPRLPQELAELRLRFGPQTLDVPLQDPAGGQRRTVAFTRQTLAGALRFLSYSATEASLLPLLIHEGADGDLAPLAAQAILMSRQIGGQLASGMQNTVVCSEDVPYFAAAKIDQARLARTYLGTDQLEALREICALWPRGPVDSDLHAPLDSRIPTLLLAGEDDPVTPPAAAERLAAGLSRHRLLVLPGEGHGQLATGCVPRLMAAFLSLDEPERLDASCLAAHRPAAFFLRFAGPAP